MNAACLYDETDATVTWSAEFYLSHRTDSVPIIITEHSNPAFDGTWADKGPKGWAKACLYRHGPKHGKILIDRFYS